MNLENFVLGFFNFIGNLDFNIFGTIIGVLLFIFWFVLVGWVWIDSGERTSDVRIRVVYLLLVIVLNIPGLIIYLIVRPSETIEDIYWADLERRYLKYETAELGDCPKCGSQLYPGYQFCANCGYDIKMKCPNCEVLIPKTSEFCPYCGTKLDNSIENDESYPTAEIMEQQILATKEEVEETVNSNRVRYKNQKTFVDKLGDTLISIWKNLFNSDKKVEAKNVVKADSLKKKDIKKKKRKKRRRK